LWSYFDQNWSGSKAPSQARVDCFQAGAFSVFGASFLVVARPPLDHALLAARVPGDPPPSDHVFKLHLCMLSAGGLSRTTRVCAQPLKTNWRCSSCGWHLGLLSATLAISSPCRLATLPRFFALSAMHSIWLVRTKSDCQPKRRRSCRGSDSWRGFSWTTVSVLSMGPTFESGKPCVRSVLLAF
jgi:hypothetical protein